MPRADVILNPISGSSAGRRAVETFRASLEAAGWDVRFRPTERAGHAPELAREAAASGADAVVAAGGDGTINEVARGLLAAGADAPPLAVLARGTSNLLARDLGIPFDPRGAAAVVAAGAVRRIDAAAIGERTMLCCAGAGWDAHVVRELSARRTGHIRVSTWFGPIRSALRDYAFPEIRVTADGAPPVTGVLVLVLNCRPYAKFFAPAPAARPDDGALDVVVVLPEGRSRLPRLAWKAWRGTMQSDPCVRAFRAREVRLEADVPVPLQVDGDAAGTIPAAVTLAPLALRVLAPTRKT